MLVRGKAEKPTYILVDEQGVEFKSAAHLWGMTTDHAQQLLKGEVGDDGSITCIGPAGENLVPYACVINEWSRLPGSRSMHLIIMKSDKVRIPAITYRILEP